MSNHKITSNRGNWEPIPQCTIKEHNGLEVLLLPEKFSERPRLPNPNLGQDVAFIAFLMDRQDKRIEHLLEENARLQKEINTLRSSNR